MATLYRKYRPQRFAEVVGQNHIKLTLQHEIASNQLAHAYLFCGPRAVGKTTLARVLAKALNCLERKEGEFEPCDKCQTCADIAGGRALDIIEIDAASHTGVDNVRENIIANARVAPFSLRYKVFIIDEVHQLSSFAFNALLKIMEEPPEKVVFILCTTEVHKVPTTVISRCQRFDFKKISVADMVKKLEYIISAEGLSVDQGVLESVARYAGGHLRDAESLLGQIVSLAEAPGEGRLAISAADAALVIPRNNLLEVLNLLDYLAKKDAGGAINLINRLLYDGFDLKIFANDLIEILRQMILVKINPDLAASLGADLGESLEEKLLAVGGQLQLNQLLKFAERFIRAQQELKESFILQLPLELAVVELTLETPAMKGAPLASPVVVGPRQTAAVSLEEISGKWQEFLTRVKRVNHSLSFVLKVCRPTGVEGNNLCLAFKHKIHQDRISELEIKRLVEEVLKEVYGSELIISSVLDESLVFDNNNGENIDKTGDLSNNSKTKTANDEAINNILKNFGGKIVG